ncbi:pyridoxal phosphate-dependent aminotransferase [bacterium]|nr:pyridoxal phosphate-dependent aminotransferase [bacterium]
MAKLAARALTVSDSFTLKLNAQVQELQKSGVNVANLTTGEPDFPVPDAAKDAVRQALDLNRSKYTPVPGIPPLREAIARRTNGQQPALVSVHGEWSASNVVVTNGGKQAIFNAMSAVLEAGDQVLFPSPFWLSYPEMAKLVGGAPYPIATRFENSFKMKPKELLEALNLAARAKLLIMNSPCNPTGAVYSRQELQDLGAVIQSHPRGKELWILSDEIYDRVLLGDKPFCSFLEACPELRDQVITVNGMSKAAAMTGWRVGWTVAVSAVTSAMATVQGQSTSGINALAQWASLAALALPESEFAQQIGKYRERCRLVLEILSKAGKLKVVAPEGAFYVFFGVQGYLKPSESAAQFCESLLRDAQVALVPGDPFGAPGFVRLSFATDEATLKTGCERLVGYLNSR